MLADLRFALRQLAKSPGFTAVAVLSLALGIGATTTVFCWIQSILLNPLPGTRHPEQMVVLTTMHGDRMWDTVSLPDIKDYRQQKEIFAGIIGSQVTPACLTVGQRSTWIYGQVATANFFAVLGVRPLLGRTFLPDEDQKPGGDNVLVLGEAFWRREFNADPAVIGRQVELNRHPFTIVGVVPAAFHGTMSGLVCDFWAPVSMTQQVANFGSLDVRTDRWLHTQARLQPGVTIARAQTVVDAVGARLELAYPAENRQIRLRVLDFLHAPYGAQPIFGRVLGILMAVSCGVLLIVVANLASLLLARATGRGREIAVRLALGAGRARLVRQLLTESLVLALLGGGLGVLAACWAVDLLAAWIPPTPLPVGLDVHIDGATLAFTLAGTLATGVLFGLVPALRASQLDLNSTLKEGGRSSTAAGHQRLRSLFVVGEIALSLTLLIGAGLCIKSTRRAYAIDPGFDPHHVLLAGLRIGMNGYDESTGKIFYRELETRLAALPGVESVALSSWFPLGFEGGPANTLDVPGYVPKPGEDTSVPYAIVSPRYFATLRIPLLAGRDFTDHDDAQAPGVAIVNETLAQRFWPGRNPLGRKFLAGGWRHLTVVGVAHDGKYRSLNEPPRPFFYTPYRQGVWDLNLGLCLRLAGDPAAFGPTLQREIRRLDPRVQVWATVPMSGYIKAAYVAPELASRLLVWLGFVALALAAMGVYGVVAYAVSQRTQEFGVRLALGAQARDVLGLVLRYGLRLATLGIALGLLAAFAVSRLLTGFLHGVSPLDPATFAAVPVLLFLVALLACYLPARRATKVNPLDALRAE